MFYHLVFSPCLIGILFLEWINTFLERFDSTIFLFLPFQYYSEMSTRHSPRARAPSNLAVQAAASSQPPRKRLRSSGPSSVSSLGGPSARVQEIPASIQETPTSVQETPLTAEIIDTIVQGVTDAVTQRLASGSSTDNAQSLAVSASNQLATNSATPGLAPPATLLEVPVGAPHSTTLQAQVAGPATTAPPAPGPSTSPSFAEAVVNTSLAIAQASIAGMPSTPECLFNSPSLPIDARVSGKIRGKIWNSEYFDFSLLLSNPVAEDRYQLTVTGAEGNSAAPAICLEPSAKSKNVLTVDAWFNCFHIFVGIYCQKYPTEAPTLMKYGEVVQDLAASGHNWKFYDENFRVLRQS